MAKVLNSIYKVNFVNKKENKWLIDILEAYIDKSVTTSIVRLDWELCDYNTDICVFRNKHTNVSVSLNFDGLVLTTLVKKLIPETKNDAIRKYEKVESKSYGYDINNHNDFVNKISDYLIQWFDNEESLLN